MYDEFERAVTGRSASGGMSVMGWVAAAFGFFFLVGLVGIGFAVSHAGDKAKELALDFDVGDRLADLAVLADLESQRELISMDPDRGLDFLRGLEGGDPTEAFMGEVVRGAFGLGAHRGHAPHAPQVPELPALPELPDVPGAPHVSADGDVVVDVDRADGHRSLVINADGGEVRFDLVRTDGGGVLTIDSEDGRTRINLRGTEKGGFLAIDSDGESLRFDLTNGDNGAQLVINKDDETVRLGMGDEAQTVPGWVPRFEGMPEAPRPVYSLDAPDGILGAASWSGTAAPSDILSWYRAELEAQGYDVRHESSATGDGTEEGAFWARNEVDGRVVFVVAHAESGGTKVLLGYGEER